MLAGFLESAAALSSFHLASFSLSIQAIFMHSGFHFISFIAESNFIINLNNSDLFFVFTIFYYYPNGLIDCRKLINLNSYNITAASFIHKFPQVHCSSNRSTFLSFSLFHLIVIHSFIHSRIHYYYNSTWLYQSLLQWPWMKCC